MRTGTPGIADRLLRRGVLWGALAALLPLAALTGFAVLTALAAFRTAEEARLRDTARALAAAVDAELGATVAALRALATSPLFDGEVEPEAVTPRFRDVGDDFAGWIVLLGPPPVHPILAMGNQADPRTLPSRLPATTALALRDQ